MERDPFEVLGIQHGADPAVVSAAYKALSKKYHPDLNPNDSQAAEKMKDINQAYTAIRAGDYKDEAYYHPERQTRQTYTPPQGNYGNPQNHSQNPQAGQQTAYQTQSAYQEYPGFVDIVADALERKRKENQQSQHGQKKRPKAKRQWYYNNQPVSFGKAIFYWSWDRWLKQVLVIILAVAVLFAAYKIFSGKSLSKELKENRKKLQSSLTKQESKITLPTDSHMLMVNQASYQVVFPG